MQQSESEDQRIAVAPRCAHSCGAATCRSRLGVDPPDPAAGARSYRVYISRCSTAHISIVVILQVWTTALSNRRRRRIRRSPSDSTQPHLHTTAPFTRSKAPGSCRHRDRPNAVAMSLDHRTACLSKRPLNGGRYASHWRAPLSAERRVSSGVDGSNRAVRASRQSR